MSRIATKPSASWTCSPSWKRLQKRQSSGSDDPPFRDRAAADVQELADVALDEPGRIVVAVATPGAVDEDRVLATELRAPVLEAGDVRCRAQACTSFLFLLRRHWIVRCSPGSRPRRVGKDVHLRQTCGANGTHRVLERALVLRRKADDHVGRQVEVGQWLEPAQIR